MLPYAAFTAVRQNTLHGILFMCLAVALMPVMNTIAKMLATEYPLQQVVWARFAGHFLIMLLLFMPRRGWRVFVTTRPLVQFARSVTMFASNGCYIVALSLIPLATASSVSFTAPLIVTALSMPLLGERVGPRRWAAVLVGFAGALIIIRPDGASIATGEMLVLVSATSFAFYQILTRKLVAVDAPDTLILYTALAGTLITSAVVPFYFEAPREWLHALGFVLLGGIGGAVQYLVIKALQYAPAAITAPFAYGQLIGATVLGYFFFGDFPDSWTWVGAAIIVASGVYVAYRERVRAQEKNRS
ncbi:MAG: DMT family transporter [Alphaproteobacteria bacterium]